MGSVPPSVAVCCSLNDSNKQEGIEGKEAGSDDAGVRLPLPIFNCLSIGIYLLDIYGGIEGGG
jgi:hypothetical protein